MLRDERLDGGQNWLLFHDSNVSRVITRRSSLYAGIYTKLRVHARSGTADAMENAPAIDLGKLKADMAAHVPAKQSARQFSLAVTGGENPDFYRNFLGGQDKRMSAEIFFGIINALGRNPRDYVEGLDLVLPNETVLTYALSTLLGSIGIDPWKGELARTLASKFPDILRSAEEFHKLGLPGTAPHYGEGDPDPEEVKPPA